MDVAIWTKFDKNPITLRAIDAHAAMKFKERASASELDYATIHTVDGFHMFNREHIVRVHFLTGTVQ